MKRDTLFLETTEVPAAKSIGEITSVLVKAGAREIATTYEAGEPAGVRWSMHLYGRLIWFELPVRIQPIAAKLQKRPGTRRRAAELLDRARRIAWRQLLMWTRVQMAMIEQEQAEFAQVFLAYIVDSSNRTMWDAVRESQFRALPSPEKPQ